MASTPWPAVVLLLLVLNTGVVSANQNETTEEEGRLLDARTFTHACFENASCEPSQPTHLVEYFSADWCEPCVQVGELLDNLSDEKAVVLQHHASPQDATFLSDSKLKYDQEFRLLFYPSVVVNGKHLLTGSRQALDLESVMENNTPTWYGLESLMVENQTMTWNASREGTVSVWLLAPTPHQTSGKIHHSVAYERLEVDAGAGTLTIDSDQLRANTSFVVLLEEPGRRTLSVASLAPTGPVDISEGGEVSTSPGTGWFDREMAMMVGLVLVLALAPAFVIHRELMTGAQPQKRPIEDDNE